MSAGMARPGLWAPTLAVVLATAAGVLVLRGYALHCDEVFVRWEARASARALATGRLEPAPYLDTMRVREVRGASKHRFLRRFEEAATGRALRPEVPAEKAVADLVLLARGGEAHEATPGGHRAAVVGTDDQIAVVHAPRGELGAFWLPAALAAFVGWLLWIGVLRRTGPARWVAPVGAGVTASLLVSVLVWMRLTAEQSFGAARFDESLAALLPMPTPVGASLVIAAPLLPLVVYGVAGYVTASRRSPHRAAYLYVAPAVVGLALLILVPFTIGIGLAFLRHEAGSFSWVGLDNFVSILRSEGYAITHPLSFYYTSAVTVLWTGLNVCFHAGIGLALALVLNREDLRFRGVYRVLLIVPWAIPNYITALVWKGMFNKQYGVVNHVLGLVGLEPVGWFSSFWAAFSANLATNTWLGFPFMMVVALGALQSIPKDLYEAASVDGATRWQQFRAITLPLLKPAMFPAIILGSIWTFNMFNIIYLVSGGQPNASTDILIVEAYRWAFEQDRYGYAAAYSVLIFLMLLGYSLVTQRVTRAAE